MSFLTAEIIKRSCTFVLQVQFPLVIHCWIEKDLITHTVSLLSKIEGVIEVEWIEARA